MSLQLSNEHILWNLSQLEKTDPNKILFSFLDDQGQITEQRTVSEFIGRIENLAGYLRQGCQLQPGDSVLLIYPPSMEFIEAFAACLLAGVIAAPVYPPNLARPNADLNRLNAITTQSGAKAMLTNRAYRWAMRMQSAKQMLSANMSRWPDLPWHVTQGLSWFTTPLKTTALPCADHVALLQFTSGSTSVPKGVQITHKNLKHQLAYNAEALGMNADSKLVMWVPQYHDLGLISGILSILQGNGSLYFMSPFSFLKNPSLWFDTIHKYRATHTAAPNFGYELATRKINSSMRLNWDLSSLKVCMSAAEPIVPKTVDGFLNAFSECKLSPNAFCPAYGLAEHTVGITIGGRARLSIDRVACVEQNLAVADPTSDFQVMGCGSPGFDVQVRIVSPETGCVLKENEIGEIWAQSESVAKGYVGLEELSQKTFHAQLKNEPGHWLRTGDLGFLHGNELFITGRHKDLIIIRGKNFNPETIEDTVRQAHELIRPGGVVAFSVPSQDTEKLVVIAETLEPSPEKSELIANAIKRHVSEVWNLQATVGIAPKGTIKKTTSGKLQRNLCRQMWMENKFDLMTFEQKNVGTVANTGHDQRPLKEQLNDMPFDDRLDHVIANISVVAKQILPEGFQNIGVDDFLPDAGLDSLSSFDLITALEEQFQLKLPPALFIEHPTLRSVSARILSDLGFECDSMTDSGILQPSETPLSFRPAQRGMVPGQTHIGIVGAGVAGMVSALELAQLGYKHITLFESNDSCGGKVASVHQDGDVLEFGQNVFIDSFRVLLDIAMKLKCDILPVRSSFLWWDEAYGFEESPSRLPYKKWVKSLFKAARLDASDPLPLPQLTSDLDMPFEDFLKKHNLGQPHPIFFFEWNSMGYGVDMQIPTSYVLSYLQTLGTSGNACYLAQGNQMLWTKLEEHLKSTWGVTILKKHPVESIAPHEHGVTLTAMGKTFSFDEVILAAPPSVLRHVLPKQDPLQDILSRFHSYTFVVDGFKAQGFPDFGCAFPNKQAFEVGPVVAIQKCRNKKGWYISGQYAKSFEQGCVATSKQELNMNLEKTVEKMGAHITQMGQQHVWDYFPHTRHAPSQTLRQAEALQGQRHLWTTGSWMCFEVTELVARHAQHLIRTCFDPACD